MELSKVSQQPRAEHILTGFIESRRIPQALLFYGLEGTGKALMAAQFAQALLCHGKKSSPLSSCGQCASCLAAASGNHLDIVRVNAQYQACLRQEDAIKQKTLRVDTIRHLRRDMEMRSMMGDRKIAIIEEAHTLEIEAANALLKILEEPQSEVLWILTTSRRGKLPRTVLSRCIGVPFSPLPKEVVRKILLAEGVPEARAEALAVFCEGSASLALELSQGNYPDSLIANGLSPLEAADSLPRELPAARAQVEAALFSLMQKLRLDHLQGALPFTAVERPLRELKGLREALRANTDPKNVVLLAGWETRRAEQS